MFRICGPKCSLCCTIISIWGIIQLTLMGGFFYIKSVSLAEDLGIGDFKDDDNITTYLMRADEAYDNQAKKCWFSVLLYAASLLVSLWQLFLNMRRSSYETTR